MEKRRRMEPETVTEAVAVNLFRLTSFGTFPNGEGLDGHAVTFGYDPEA